MKENNDCKDNLKYNGLKNTKQRTAILEILKKSDQPLSAEQIYFELSEKKIGVSLSTVYRALEIMVLKELVTKLSVSSDNKALFELNHMVHRHYLVCLGCKKILAINYCPLENYEESLSKETGFMIVGHKLDIYGYCPECKMKLKMGPD